MELAAIVLMIESVAKQHNFDPALLQAVAQVESNYRPNATGSKGEIGLFQIMPLHYKGKSEELYSPKVNAKEAIKVLKEAKKYCHVQDNLAWLSCYNAGVTGAKRITNPEEFQYVVRVRKAYNKVKAKEALKRVKYATN